jgi:hypothetical protein
MTGGLLQLAAYGAQDVYLTGNPQITFFVGVYRRYTNFAIQNIPQYFTGNGTFGQKVYCQLDRIGDLVNQTFLHIVLPELEQYYFYDENDVVVEYYWVNSVGHALIKIIEVEIGGVVIDRQYGIWMEIWMELTTPTDKIHGLNEMIGRSDSPINYNNNKQLDLYVPLRFWFCKNIGLSLPLIALQAQEVRINLTIRQFEELIVSSNGLPPPPEVFSNIEIISCNLEVDYIFLEDTERKIFAKTNHQYLIDQVQVYATSLTSNGLRQDPTDPNKMDRIPDLNQNFYMNFNNPVKELIWVIQNKTVLSLYPYGGNEWFNFSTEPYKSGVKAGEDPMTDAKILFEGQDLFDLKSSKYFRNVVPYQRHTRVPNNFIYVYSFAINPEDFQPSGTCNFSRIDNQQIYMQISDKLIDPIITVFAVNYNILNIAGGMGGIEYIT